jgi:tetratricopeptide (TPR) repeat protein
VHAFRRIGAFIEYNLGAVLYLSNRGEEAVPHLDRSLELGGEFLALRPMAYYLLGRIAALHGEYDTAQKRFEEALKYNRDNASWYVELSKARMKNGQAQAAVSALREGLLVHPGNRDITAELETFKPTAATQPPPRRRVNRPAPPAKAE